MDKSNTASSVCVGPDWNIVGAKRRENPVPLPGGEKWTIPRVKKKHKARVVNSLHHCSVHGFPSHGLPGPISPRSLLYSAGPLHASSCSRDHACPRQPNAGDRAKKPVKEKKKKTGFVLPAACSEPTIIVWLWCGGLIGQRTNWPFDADTWRAPFLW